MKFQMDDAWRALVVGDDDPGTVGALYNAQLTLAVVALIVNGLIVVYAAASDAFPPHTVVYRTILTVDVIENVGYIFEAITGAAAAETPSSLNYGTPFRPASANARAEPLGVALTRVNDCATGRPFLFALLIARQWSAAVVLMTGFERFLSNVYPLWFSSIRVRLDPIVIFTLLLATMSAAVAYTNSLFVAPDELTSAACHVTWAFGEHYGWFFSFFVLVPHSVGCAFVAYARRRTASVTALPHFGNNRAKLSSERRKIRARTIVLLTAFFACAPQLAGVLLHVASRWRLNALKLAAAQLLSLKFLANFYIYRTLGHSRRGIFYAARMWMINRQKRRVTLTESITSISVNVN